MSVIDQAFVERPDLKKRTYEAIANYPELDQLFHEISNYVQTLQSPAGSDVHTQASKKRKLNGDGDTSQEPKQESSNGNGVRNGHWGKGSYTEIKEISFSVPQRKKLTLELGNLPGQGLRASNPSTGNPEFQVQWSDVQQVVCLPVPEKAQPQYNFCVFTNTSAEQVVWTVPASVPKAGIFGADIPIEPDETYKDILIGLLNERLKHSRTTIIQPDEKEFVSQTAQAHRKGEKAVHVKAFRGSKDGFLFFLPTGIIWGFKKPLEFFSFDSIDSVSYTSVLQRTFNLVITLTTSAEETQEFEFSMLDQADFAGIDAYVRRHQLQDASMAEQRRAKKLNVNGVKGEKGEDAEPEGREGELEKAAREAEDLEDEDEEEDENFDPGSEGESEGSGSSEEEDGGDGGAEGDIVQEELGSEAEEVDGEEGDE